ncbi:MAG: acyltransferase, partial [Prevotella shahii]|nr:acyltransferase [Hoylesella shahii]
MNPSPISAGAFADTKPHYHLLDGLRGVAALVVICFHIGEDFATNNLTHYFS